MSNRKKKKVNRQQVLFLLGILCLAIVGGFFYLEYKRTSSLKTAEFIDLNGKEYATVYLEVAETPEQRKLGLMFRQSLPSDQGMLFKFDQTKIQSIWMKNTYISLDLLFLSSDLKIVGILEKVPVLNENSRKIATPSRYVIELNAGTVERLGIKAGDSIKLQN